MKTYLQKHKKMKYSDHWSTPSNIYDLYVKRLNYIDPCPLHSEHNNLDVNYRIFNLFINPPYSDITSWIDFAIKNHIRGLNHIVLLVPSRTDVKWFHKLLDYGVRLEFIKGRLKFGNSKNSAPFPSVLIHLE